MKVIFHKINQFLFPLEIFTDGSLKKSKGAWAYVIVRNKRVISEASGVVHKTTSNRMELQAAIEALKTLPPKSRVALYSDSRVLIDSLNLTGKQPLPDLDLIKALEELTSQHKISWNWVKGHSGNLFNERCDRLCTAARGN